MVIGALMNPDNANSETELRVLNEAARTLGLKLQVANARSKGDFEPAFASLIGQGPGGLAVLGDAYFTRRIEQLAGAWWARFSRANARERAHFLTGWELTAQRESRSTYPDHNRRLGPRDRRFPRLPAQGITGELGLP